MPYENAYPSNCQITPLRLPRRFFRRAGRREHYGESLEARAPVHPCTFPGPGGTSTTGLSRASFPPFPGPGAGRGYQYNWVIPCILTRFRGHRGYQHNYPIPCIFARGRAACTVAVYTLCATHPDCNGSGARLVVAEGRACVYALCNTSRLQRQWSSVTSGGGTSSCIRSAQHIQTATAVELG